MLIRIGQCFGSDSLNVVLSREEAQVCGFWLILHEGQTLFIPSQMQETVKSVTQTCVPII